MSDPRYPIGKFTYDGTLTEQQKQQYLNDVELTPANLRAALFGLSEQQLDTPYRNGGWSVRQVTHHVADSHMNAYIRHKLAVTEHEPTIKPYEQKLWAELSDAAGMPIEVSLSLLDALHARWTVFLHSLEPAQYGRLFRHPELGVVPLDRNIALYAWHGRHHTAHITALRERMEW